ncbi:MAG: HNH endonuclease [Spirochaetota bacterium]|nr:HNH endonuclease [Spirochaetota bacterium]
MVWMISANGKMYDHASSFSTYGFIDWRQKAKYEIGDIVFIYCTNPLKKVMYKCEVIKCNMQFSECIDDHDFWFDIKEYEKSQSGFYARLKLIEQTDTENLSLDKLKEHGLISAPQGPIKVSKKLENYINNYFNDFYIEGFFNDVSKNESYHEGHIINAIVNKYERSSIARMKCIEYYGSSCIICGINFGKKYGSLGEGFIHIHHLRPLHTIGKDYIVDYKKDLVPVCPNCHAMIHRIENGENLTIEELKVKLT